MAKGGCQLSTETAVLNMALQAHCMGVQRSRNGIPHCSRFSVSINVAIWHPERVIEAMAWPGAVLLLALFCVIVFRAEIRKLFPRVKKVWGLDLDSAAQDQQIVPAATERSGESLANPFESVALRENEASVRADLDRRAPTEPSRRVDFLVRQLASLHLIYSFEIISRTIWGSQIDLLLNVNTKIDGEAVENMRAYYDVAAAQAADSLAGYSYERYIGYLSSQRLVNEQAGRIHITHFGKEFLAHLARSGATYRRPY